MPTLVRPGSLQIGAKGDFFVRDDGDLSIKKFSAAGVLKRKYGTGEGEGRGAFRALTDFIVDAKDRVWVADPISRRVTVFSEDGTVDRMIGLSSPPYRLAYVSDARMIVMLRPVKASSLFALFDIRGKSEILELLFGNLLSNQARDAAALDGWVSNSRTAFVLAPMYCGYLICYDLAGKLRFIVETIGSRGLPAMKASKPAGNARLLDGEVSPSSLCVSSDADHVYVLSPARLASNKIGAVDVYSMNDGHYQYSFRLPEPSRRMVVQNGKIFTFRDEVATGWEINFTDSPDVTQFL
jgi:hypothetical protein